MKGNMFSLVSLFLAVLLSACGSASPDANNDLKWEPNNDPLLSEGFAPSQYEGFYKHISDDCPAAFKGFFSDTNMEYVGSSVIDHNDFYRYLTDGGISVWTDSQGSEVAFCIQGLDNATGFCKYNQACVGNNLKDESVWKLTCDDTYGGICYVTYERN